MFIKRHNMFEDVPFAVKIKIENESQLFSNNQSRHLFKSGNYWYKFLRKNKRRILGLKLLFVKQSFCKLAKISWNTRNVLIDNNKMFSV